MTCLGFVPGIEDFHQMVLEPESYYDLYKLVISPQGGIQLFYSVQDLPSLAAGKLVVASKVLF